MVQVVAADWVVVARVVVAISMSLISGVPLGPPAGLGEIQRSLAEAIGTIVLGLDAPEEPC